VSSGSAIDVVVVAYGSGEAIATCLDGARAIEGVGQIVVVDHGTDGAGDVAETMGARVLRDPANPGFGTGQNRGVAATSAPYVLLLNPDAVPVPDGIAAGLALMEQDDQVAAVQGVITNRTTGAPERSSGRELGPVHLLGRALGLRRLLAWSVVRATARRIRVLADHVDRVPDEPRPVASLAATAVLIRRSAFVAVNGFDVSYFLYGEDLDLCRRLRRDGWTLVGMPCTFALHEGGASAASSAERELTWWRGTMHFAARWWSAAAWLPALLAAAIAWLRVSIRHPSLAVRAWRALLWEPFQDRHAARSLRWERRSMTRVAEAS
jgi:N-acetylglucosaminyl-diphospho-decaprenol L-rhamnosyltransferase